MRLRSAFAFLAVSVLALTACAGNGAGDDQVEDQDDQPLESVALRLDWSWGAEHLGYLAAQQLGYYEDAGLEVEITEGEGSAVTATLVGTNEAEFGIISAGEILAAVDSDLPVRAVATIVQSSPNAVIYNTDVLTVETLSDLYGFKKGVVPQSSGYKEWEAVASLNDIDRNQIEEVAVGQALVQSILTGQVDAIMGWTFNQGVQARVEGANVDFLLYTDIGYPAIPNSAIATNIETLENRPAMIEQFVQASIEGWRYVESNRDEALEMLFDERPEIDVEYNTQKLPLVLDLMGEPTAFGEFNAEAWVELVDLYYEQEIINNPIEVEDDLISPEFVN